MIRDTFTGEVVKDYELEDDCRNSCSKLLGKASKYIFKRTGGYEVTLAPYSRILTHDPFPFSSFNNKKFSII